jgi:biopolymer transport protein TolQ
MVSLQNLNELAVSVNGGIDLVESFKNSSMMVIFIMALLIVFSVISWALIAYKFIQYRKAMIETEKFVAVFWKNISHDEIFQKSSKMNESPVAMVFSAGYSELKETKESWEGKGLAVIGSKVDELAQNVERTMKRESQARVQLLENRLQFLATTASASPFIGLLGTVYGIMNAFEEIGRTGSATLGSIAPHISEALVTTAFGLIAAIPATIFYNYFLSLLTKFENESANITADFINQIKRSNV